MSKRGQNEGSIFEERPGRWVASISAGYVVKDGKRRRLRKKFVAPTRKAVQEKLTAALRAQQLGINVAPERRTVEQFLNYWIAAVLPNSEAKPKTRTFYSYITRIHLIPNLGTLQLEKLSPQHVQAFLNERAQFKSERTGKPLASRSIRHIHRTLCTALEVAVRYSFVQRNVALLVDPPRALKPNVKFLSVEQARILLAAVESNRLRALFSVILCLGLRLGEALGLCWNDIDMKSGKLTVRNALQRVNKKLVLVDPKSDNSRRILTLPAVAIAALNHHRALQKTERTWAADGWKGNAWDLVFTSSVGTPLNERNVLRSFQDQILERAGLPKMRIHDLRHSAVAILIAQGVSSRAISEMLGHSSVAFTLQVYGHLMEETKRETASKMDEALAPVAPLLAPSKASVKVN